MFSTFTFMAMLPFQTVQDALKGATVVTLIAMIVPGSTAFTQRVEAQMLGN
jgi:hypothetical protein